MYLYYEIIVDLGKNPELGDRAGGGGGELFSFFS